MRAMPQRSRRLGPLALAALVTVAGCKDPSAPKPPPEHLTRAQRAEVAAHTLAHTPEGLLEPPGGPVTLGGGRLRYLGLSVDPSPPRRGAAVSVTFYWEALRHVDHDWKVFVHVSPPGVARAVIGADGWSVDGLWPTSRWQPGKVYADVHRFALPATWLDPSLQIYVGLYRLNARMPVDRRSASDGANRIRAATVPVAGGALPLPTYKVPYTATPPKIDGLIDDPVWKQAPAVDLVRSDGRGKAALRTTARLLWDDAHLYVAWDVEDPDVWSSYTHDDDPLYKEEAVEIFLDGNADGRTYNEIELAPTGHVFDARFEGPRQGMDLAWSSKMVARVHVDGTLNDPSDTDRGYTAEMAIPIARLYDVRHLPPHPGDLWRFNLYRLEHPGRTSELGMAFSPPVIPDFHNVRRFAKLVFQGPAPKPIPARGATPPVSPPPAPAGHR